MKNKGLIITLIILLSIAIFFLVMFLVTYLNGGINFRNGIFNIGSKSTKIVFDKEFEIFNIQNINVKQDTGDVIIKEAQNDNIKVIIYGEDVSDVSVNMDDGNLNIDYYNEKNFHFFNFGNIKNDIIIYVPATYADNINLKNDYGNIEITDLENATVDINNDCGNVKLGKIKNAVVECDCGNVEINEILNKFDIEVNCGNVEIDKIFINEDSNVEVDLGDIDINSTNDIYIDANVDLGKKNVNKNNRNSSVTLKVKCDCGNIEINN